MTKCTVQISKSAFIDHGNRDQLSLTFIKQYTSSRVVILITEGCQLVVILQDGD